MRQALATIWILLHLLLEKGASQDLVPFVGRITRSEYAACASAGRMPNSDAETCESYYLCAVNTDGSLTVGLAYCPLSTVFSPEKLQCVSASTYVCPNASPVVAESAAVTAAGSESADESDPFQCPEVGRFPNSDSADCKLYYLCSRNQNGDIEAFSAQCPGQTVFDAKQGVCVASAPGVCPTAPTPPPTSPPEVTQFVCPDIGRFLNEQSLDCKLYYLCSRNQNGDIEAFSAQCPGQTVFDAKQGVCVASAPGVCPTAPTPPPTSPPEVTQFVCPDIGRFLNEQSLDCKLYYLCSRNQNGDIEAFSAQCPGQTVFDANQGSCVASAPGVCPTAPTPPPTPPPEVTQFVCPGVGRFPNEQSLDCKLYYLCSRDQNGKIEPYSVQCPLSTVFRPDELKCVSPESYTCPRSTTEPTVTDTPTPTTIDPPTTETPTTSETPTTIEVDSSSTTESVTEVTDGQTMEPIATDTPTPTTIEPPTTETPTISETPTTVESSSTTESVTKVTDGQTMEPIATDTQAPTTIEPPTTETPTTSETPTTVESTSTTESFTEVTDGQTMEPTVTDTPASTTIEPPTTEAPTTSETPTPVESSSTTESVTEVTDGQTMEPTVTDTPTPTTIDPPTTETPTTSETPTTIEVDSSSSTESVTEVTDGQTMEPIATDTPAPTTIDPPTTETPTTSETPTPVESSSTTESVTEVTDGQTMEPTVTDTPAPTTIDPSTTETATSSEATGATSDTETPSSTSSTTESSTADPGMPPTDGTTAGLTPSTEAPTDSPNSSTTLAPFVCPGLGRYSDPEASACESYLLCIENSLGTLTAVPLPCPQASIFSEARGTCVPANMYNCGRDRPTEPDLAATSTTATALPTMSPTTSQPIIPTPEPFVCTSYGRHVNPGSIYCKSYYLCLYDTSNRLYPIELSCPMNSIFHEVELRCVSADEHTCTLAETTTTTTTTTTSAPTTNEQPVCVAKGKFPAPYQVPNCQTYTYCIQAATGDFLQYSFRCPQGTLFDEDRLACSGSYVCPR